MVTNENTKAYQQLEQFKKGIFHPEDVLNATKEYHQYDQNFALLPALEACRKITDIQDEVLDDKDLEFKKYGQYVPRWILDAFEDILVRLLKSDSLGGIESKQNAMVEFRSCYIDLTRFEAVMNARSPNGGNLKGDAAFEKAILDLEGTKAGGVGISAFKGSVKKVRRRFKNPISIYLNLPISKRVAEKILG